MSLLVSACHPEQFDRSQGEGGFDPSLRLSLDELLDPQSCAPCHPDHYQEWSLSAHAAASTDPIFRALNELGQRETQGQLGSFCVQCHAPVALELNVTSTGLNLDEVPRPLQGVTCAYCHQITEIRGDHNNPLTWTHDGVMRGGIREPDPSSAHRSTYSPLLDGAERSASDLCGSCHDIVTPQGVHLERTYLEWSESVFAEPERLESSGCISCHMPSRAASITAQTPERRHHNHLMPGVDPLLTYPMDEEIGTPQLRAEPEPQSLEAIQRELNFSLISQICAQVGANGGGEIELYLENIGAGHRFPSGAALDRRLWVELDVIDAEGVIMWQSGHVPPDTPAVEIEAQDPSMWLIRDRALNESGQETHRFWEITHVERGTLPTNTGLTMTPQGREEPHVLRRYRFATPRPIVTIELRVKMRPMALELIQELTTLELLDPQVLDLLPTFELNSAARIWRLDQVMPQVTRSGRELLCSAP